MATRRAGVGDGDACPVDPQHGYMLVIPGRPRQYCPNVEHAGRPKTHPLGATDPTPCFWPTGWKSFEDAVKAYHQPIELPDLDFTLEV